MKKTKKKLLLTAVTTMLACTMSAGLVMTAFADEATKDHEFDARNGDVVFEDFDRANLEGVVSTTTSDLTDIGVKPYLHVEFEAMEEFTGKGADESDEAYAARWNAYCGARNAWIYKQGSGSLAKVKDGGAIRITMRAPDGDVNIGDLCFAVRGGDDAESSVLVKNFGELADSSGADMPALSSAWATYEISFATSYESDEVYPTTTIPVIGDGSADVTGLHIFPVADKAGAIDIQSVEYKTTGNYQYLNDFIGGSTVQDTAKAANEATWWAGSDNGAIVKRVPTLTNGGDLLVVKEAAVGDYKYAVIEVEGDAAHLKVATTTDGTTFDTAAAYDGYSVALTGDERGFKFTYDGEESVKIKRIYLTNLAVIVPDTATPVIDAKTAKYLDDFSVAQSGFVPYDDTDLSAREFEQAGLSWRISDHNGDKVEVKDGALVFEATDDYINYKFNSKTAQNKKYVVFKMKQDGDSPNIDGFRFGVVGSDANATTSDAVWSPNFKSGVEYKSKLLEASNPYKDGDWYYVIVDLEESGFPAYDSYSGLNLYYTGANKLYIDEIFFADKLDIPAKEYKTTATGEMDFAGTGNTYAGSIGATNDGTADILEFDITPATSSFDVSGFRLVFDGLSGEFWGDTNSKGTLITTDGKKLSELTFTAGEATHIEIDLAASNIGAFTYMHAHCVADPDNAFVLNNVSTSKFVSIYDEKELDTENPVTAEDKGKFTPTAEGYQEAMKYEGVFATQSYGKMAFTLTPGEGFSIEALRFTGPCEYWFAQHPDVVITDDGKKVGEITFTEDTPINIVIDLAEIGGTATLTAPVIFHTAGTSTGSFTVTNLALTPYKYAVDEYYGQQLGLLPLYLDNVKPTVSITNAVTATAGDEITIAYTASDNATANDKLKTEITVTKDGNAVALDGNKFTAEEGVYTVTVKVTDVAGNEATDVKQITVAKKATSDVTANNDDGKLSGGAIAGIVIGCVAGVGLIVGGVFLALHLRKKKKS